jgi:hypothetical protein
MTSQAPQAPPEQITYANLLFYGSWGAIAILLITFFVYVSGVFESYIPINEISQYWSMPVSQYVQEANIPIGWGWATLIGKISPLWSSSSWKCWCSASVPPVFLAPAVIS